MDTVGSAAMIVGLLVGVGSLIGGFVKGIRWWRRRGRAYPEHAPASLSQREYVYLDVLKLGLNAQEAGAKQKRRPVLDQALDELRTGDVLVVAKADRLARSLSAYLHLIDRARTEGWAIVAADGSIDLTTPHGRTMSAMAAVFGELEAELIGDRTKVALAAARAKGTRLGRRPARLDAALVGRVRRWRRQGWTLQRIADRLSESETPSPTGKRWHPQSVARIASR